MGRLDGQLHFLFPDYRSVVTCGLLDHLAENSGVFQTNTAALLDRGVDV